MLELDHLSINFNHRSNDTDVLHDLHVNIASPDFVVFLGPSGCGKTSLLRAIAGLISPSKGEIRLDGKKIVGPHQECGLVFQGFSLFPWLTVRENIAFPLNLSHMTEQTKEKLLDHYLQVTYLKNYADLYPINLSGGMQQRTAIARTLASDPKVLLMDEPFSSLDFQIRYQLQRLVTEIYEIQKKTIIFVTHDIEEALLLADKIYVFSQKPTSIKAEIVVPFPRPRDPHLRYNAEFSTLVRKLQEMLIAIH